MSEFCSHCQVIESTPYCPRVGIVHRLFAIRDRYEVDEPLGASAMAFVFAGRDRIADRLVAIKLLRPEIERNGDAQQRFVHEAEALGQVAHDHLVRILDFGWDDAVGATFLVMERLVGQTADAMIRRSGPLPWQQTIPLLRQVCGAVAAAHACGISDGHLTARKVFVSDDRSRATLCDFGFSSITASAENAVPFDDLYGIGTVAHELLTGRPPLEGSSAAGALSDNPIRVNERFPVLALPRALDDLIQACRFRDPMLRPSLEDLEAGLRTLDVAAAPRNELGDDGAVAGLTPRAAAATLPRGLAVHAPSPSFAAVPVAAPPPAALGSDPLALPEMIGSYRVVASLGTGGTGRVYLGQHPVIGSKVAIKVLLPEIASSAETVARFLQEARASSQIASPHIPRYFDFGTTPAGLPYAMMEYFEGETLRARLDRTGAMSVVETGQILAQIASALSMAHDTGLIHRDLKPENIFLVRPDGKLGQATPPRATAIGAFATPSAPAVQVKVLDFGIAKRVGAPSATLTQTGYFLGTPYYCAPEQVFGGEVDARADIYSLGATAFEMLSGSPPFIGTVPHILATKTTEDAPDLLVFRDVPASVAHTIRQMLARDRNDRPDSMAWVLEQLPGWLEPGAAPGEGTVTASERIARRRATDHPAPDQNTRIARASDHLARLRHDPVAAAGPARAVAAPVAAPIAAINASRSGDVVPDSTSEAMRAFVPSRGRVWRRAALVIVGVAASAGALILAVAASSSRSTGDSPPRPAPPPAGAVAPAAAPARPAGDETPAAPVAPSEAAASTGSATAPDPAAEPDAPEAAGATSDRPRSPREPGSDRRDPAATTRERRGATPASNPSGERPRTGATDDGAPPRRPSTDKKPVKKEQKDVLIVDPFSHGN